MNSQPITRIRKLSIVVATHRRPDHLAHILDALRDQTASKEDFEIIVVDNDCQPNPQVQSLCASPRYQGLILRYVHHAQLGQSGARNHGVEQAHAELVGFFDDDILPPPGWIAQAIAIRVNIKAEIYGGPYTPFYTNPPPRWFKDKYASLYYGDQAHWLPRNKYLSAGNMVWNRDLFLALGGFSENFGYIGNKKRYGEDSELCQRAYLAGYDIWYDPTLTLQHHCREERMSVRWQLASIGRHSRMKAQLVLRDTSRIDPRPIFRQILSIIKELLFYCFRFILVCVKTPFRKRKEYPYFENYVVEVIGRELRQVTLMVEMLRCLLSRSDEALPVSK
jgi:glucosyl-dolichyl phosphate glucuronosyltransferase